MALQHKKANSKVDLRYGDYTPYGISTNPNSRADFVKKEKTVQPRQRRNKFTGLSQEEYELAYGRTCGIGKADFVKGGVAYVPNGKPDPKYIAMNVVELRAALDGMGLSYNLNDKKFKLIMRITQHNQDKAEHESRSNSLQGSGGNRQ